MSYDIKISDILKEIGCGDGFHIPVANEENQLLEKEVGIQNHEFVFSHRIVIANNI